MKEHKVRKLNNNKILEAYRQGEKDRRDHKPPRPPKDKACAIAYQNGYHT